MKSILKSASVKREKKKRWKGAARARLDGMEASPSGAVGMELSEEDVWEPEVDVHALFVHYNDLYFNGSIGACTVEWSSSKMTLCAGVCSFSTSSGCRIKLSAPLLQLRPKKDLKETLLHEMIHAYLFLHSPHRDREDHGPNFQAIMHSINTSTIPDSQRPLDGYRITIYHTMIEEVEHYRVHHWICNRCGDLVKRAMNRKPQEADCLTKKGNKCRNPQCKWHTHLILCGGSYIKISEPSNPSDALKLKQYKRTGPHRENLAVKPITEYFEKRPNKQGPVIIDLTKD